MRAFEIQLIAQIIAGLWCKWRHGKLWRYKHCQVFPYENYAVNTYDCPKCGEVYVRKRLTNEEAEAFRPKPRTYSPPAALLANDARPMSVEQIKGMRAMTPEEIKEREKRIYFPPQPLVLGTTLSAPVGEFPEYLDPLDADEIGEL